ncbi:hypothetical protein ACEWY4_020579 [Coilia grayii]|uniref:ribonuclease H n=1 Tax=Coilia grayii TaxID=363190 RepID=A0ABD1JD10_9TELE
MEPRQVSSESLGGCVQQAWCQHCVGADRTPGAGGSTECVPAGLDDFPELSRTTGTLPGKYTIKLEPNARGVVHPVRRQPAALREKIIEKLHEMENDGYITKVEQPTEWVSSMVAAVRNGKVRICIDPSDLNKVIKREHHPMRTVEEVVSMIPGAKVFSVLDAKSGFLQIELDEPSSFLTTFNTPIGRFRWLRLPFGIKCAPEIFQRIMDQMLEGVPGAISVMDDILIAAPTIQEHDAILRRVVETRQLLAPTAYDPQKVKRLLDQTKDTQKYHHDHKRAGKPRVDLKPGEEVRMQPFPGSHTWTPAVVVRQHSAPRSFVVSSGDKQYRRTSQHLRHSTPTANCSWHRTQKEPWTEPP